MELNKTKQSITEFVNTENKLEAGAGACAKKGEGGKGVQTSSYKMDKS